MGPHVGHVNQEVVDAHDGRVNVHKFGVASKHGVTEAVGRDVEGALFLQVLQILVRQVVGDWLEIAWQGGLIHRPSLDLLDGGVGGLNRRKTAGAGEAEALGISWEHVRARVVCNIAGPGNAGSLMENFRVVARDGRVF